MAARPAQEYARGTTGALLLPDPERPQSPTRGCGCGGGGGGSGGGGGCGGGRPSSPGRQRPPPLSLGSTAFDATLATTLSSTLNGTLNSTLGSSTKHSQQQQPPASLQFLSGGASPMAAGGSMVGVTQFFAQQQAHLLER
jgi:hypothetical protein